MDNAAAQQSTARAWQWHTAVTRECTEQQQTNGLYTCTVHMGPCAFEGLRDGRRQNCSSTTSPALNRPAKKWQCILHL